MKKKKKIILIGLIIVLMVVAAVFISGNFFKPKPNNNEEKEITNLLKEYENQLGSLDNLKYVNNYDNNFTLAQYYKGIEVYGGTVIATKNQDSISQILNYQYNIPNDFNINPISKEEDLSEFIKVYFGDDDDVKTRLIILPLSNEEFTLAHYCYKDNKYLIIKDGDNKILGNSIKVDTIENVNFALNSDLNKYLDNFKIENKKYQLYDSKRNIEVYRIKDNDNSKYIKDFDYFYENTNYYKPVTWKKLEDVNKNYLKEIHSMYTIQKVYDYYQDVFGFKSIKLNENYKLDVFTNVYSVLSPEDNTKYIPYYDNAFLLAYDDEKFRIYIGSETNFNEDVEVMGHEYTHGYFDYIVKPFYLVDVSLDFTVPRNMMSAINEGYADIMGQIIEAYYKDDKKLDGFIAGIRNIKESKLQLRNYYDNMESHQMSLMVSRVAYLMAYDKQLNLDLNSLAKIWFNSLYKLPKYSVNFNDVEVAVLASAKDLGYNFDQIKIMAKSFEEVGYPELSNLFAYANLVINRSDYNEFEITNDNEEEKELNVGNNTLKYGTYIGYVGNSTTGENFILKENGQCEYGNQACTYTVGTCNMAQDITVDMQPCLQIKYDKYDRKLFPKSNSEFHDGDMESFKYQG